MILNAMGFRHHALLASLKTVRQNACWFPIRFEKSLSMKSYREELWFETKQRRAYVNITPQVEVAVKKSGIQEGMVLVNAMHITSSVYINDDESGLLKDYEDFLEKLAPANRSLPA